MHAPPPRPDALPSGWLAALALSAIWAALPALPALLDGALIGQPWTDLYPSVWGMWWFAEQQPGLPVLCAQLAAPEGMPFYYSSPIHGWLAWPLLSMLGVPATWNALVLLARLAGPLVAFGAGRAWGLGPAGALAAGAVYGCAPFLHGYAVEGIVEGLDGWALVLWIWSAAPAAGRRLPSPGRMALQALAFAIAVTSSWYVAASACLLAAMMGPRAWPGAAGGLALAGPGLWAFMGAFPARAPLAPEIRAMMGTALQVQPPGLREGLNPFAMTSWIGALAPGLAAWGLAGVWRGRGAAGAPSPRRALGIAAAGAVCWALSFGVGPWYELPPFSSLRFPYRLHAAALIALAWLAGAAVDRLGASAAPRWRRGVAAGLGPMIALEGLALSPIEPLLPGAPAEVPALYLELSSAAAPGALLDVPGPVAMPPGEINRSRARSRWFLYAQTAHGRPSPWRPDFNSVGVSAPEEDPLAGVRALDPLEDLPLPTALEIPGEIAAIVVHRKELGGRAGDAHRLLEAAGWRRAEDDGDRWGYLPAD